MRDQIEIYNIPKFTEHFEHNHPKVINDHLAEIEEFSKVSWQIMPSAHPRHLMRVYLVYSRFIPRS